MARCTAIKPNGERCKRLVANADECCSAHDPARADARRRAAAKGGRSRGSSEISELRDYLADLARDVRSGELEPRVGAVVCQIANTQLRALELARKIAEAEEIEERIAALEARSEGEVPQEVYRWGR